MEPTQNEHELTKKERRMLRKEEKRIEQDRRGQRKTWKRVGTWMLVVLFLGGAVYGMGTLIANGPSSPASGAASLLTAVGVNDRVKGTATSSIVLIEYSDFQCPACATYYPFVKQLMNEYGDRITFVYRNFPLRAIHKNAQLASQAAEAAGMQEMFWEMHDMLFEKQTKWSELTNARTEFVGYATTLGLDVATFETDLDSAGIKDKIEADFQSGITANIQGTPTFFLNGIQIANPRSYDEFRIYIDNALADNQ